MEKGTGAAGPTPPPFRPSQQPGLPPPPPLSRARTTASPQPATATWRPYAGVGRAAAGLLHPPGRDADPRPQKPSIHSVARASPSSLRSHSAAAAVPPCAIAGESPAARRRPHQSFKLTAESTSALAVAAVSPCERSTEVRSSCAPSIARRSCSELAGVLRRDGSCCSRPLFARSLVR